ncbi:hypothetical protein ABIE66_001767 [Peribacillus sp. B2I2]
MTVSECLDHWLISYIKKNKRYTFMMNRTKNKRIKNKAIQKASLALIMKGHMEEIIMMSRSE